MRANPSSDVKSRLLCVELEVKHVRTDVGEMKEAVKTVSSAVSSIDKALSTFVAVTETQASKEQEQLLDIQDHEVRLRRLERFFWVGVGVFTIASYAF